MMNETAMQQAATIGKTTMMREKDLLQQTHAEQNITYGTLRPTDVVRHIYRDGKAWAFGDMRVRRIMPWSPDFDGTQRTLVVCLRPFITIDGELDVEELEYIKPTAEKIPWLLVGRINP